ncbi:MAG: hypothetical protein RLZZ387_3293 [Chloroflexota bacterium]
MSVRDQMTPAQWQVLRAAPWAAGAYVATAVGGKVQEVRELLALAREMRAGLSRDHEQDLVGAVAAAVLGEAPSETDLALRPGDRSAMLAAVAAAGAAAGSVVGGAAYRRWVIELAREVAAAEVDGGFLGIGAEAMHTAEQIALAELTEALGLLDA